MRRSARWAAMGVGVAYVLILCSCDALQVISGETLSELRWNPDSTQFAYTVLVTELRRPIRNAVYAFDEHRHVRVYVYDLKRHRGPRLVYRAPTRDLTPFLVGWESDGILLETSRAGIPGHLLLVDPVRDQARELSPAAERALRPRFRRATQSHSGSESQRRVGVQFEGDQAFEWDPVTWTKRHLFDLPADWDGHPRETRDFTRHEWQYLDAIHQIRGVESEVRGESLRVTLVTYVPRPGKSARPYIFHYMVSVPVIRPYRGVRGGLEFGSAPREVMAVTRVLPPTPQRIVQSVPLERIREVWARLDPETRRYVADEQAPRVGVRLVKAPEPADDSTLAGRLGGLPKQGDERWSKATRTP